jgi:hypothetical protein
MAIVITSLITGIRTYYRANDQWIKWLALAITIGLCTYFMHGLLNNFLDSDKASAPFWGFLAMLVALDQHTRGVIPGYPTRQ